MVVVVGNTGASTNPDGAYVIMNLQPGTYQLRVTLVGYAPVSVNQVRVTTDQTTVIDASADQFCRATRGRGGPGRAADGTRKNLTATSYTMTSEQIRMLQ